MTEEDTSPVPPPVEEPATPPPEAPALEVAASEPVIETPPAEAQTAQPQAQTAQMGRSEPFATQPEPLPPQQSTSQTDAPAQVVAPVVNLGRDVLTKARATIQDRKRKKLEKILETLNTKGKITNDEVEKLLHVSDATATRYLSALEKDGKIKQVGKTGIGVVYTKI